MKVQISLDDLDEMIHENNYHVPITCQDGIMEQHFTINKVFGQASMSTIQFDGIYINYGDIEMEDLTVLKVKADFPVIEMHFALSGRSLSNCKEYAKELGFNANQHNIIYIPSFDGQIQISSSSVMRLFEIGLSIQFFERLTKNNSNMSTRMLDFVLNERPTLLHKNNLPITPQMNLVITEIINCPKEGYFKRLFIEAKVIELFMLQIEQYEQLLLGKSTTIKSYDHQKLHEAKYLVEKHLDQPLSILELSRQVGINDFKLKRGFKELFGETIFGYINNLKMERAKFLLQNEEDTTISQISKQTGYKNQTHFTSAFKRKYGVTPSQFQSRQ